jgi:DHA1 family bicyclomycin/chloramphenicol resistance-like MFS transporter
MAQAQQIRWGFGIMLVSTAANVLLNAVLEPHVAWALVPVSVFSFGWALMVPVVTLLVLEQAPDRRGMASSVHASIGSAANAVVAGAIVPLVMGSALALALGAAAMLAVGLVAWAWVRPQVT